MIMSALKLDCLFVKQTFCLIHKHSTEAFETQTLQIILNAKGKALSSQASLWLPHPPPNCRVTHRCAPSSSLLHVPPIRKMRAMILLLWALPIGKLAKILSWGVRWISECYFSSNAAKGCQQRSPHFAHPRTDGAVRKAPPISERTDRTDTTFTACPGCPAQLLPTISGDPVTSHLHKERAWHHCCTGALAPPPTLTSSFSVFTAHRISAQLLYITRLPLWFTRNSLFSLTEPQYVSSATQK